MKTTRILAVLVLIAASGWALHVAQAQQAQQAGIKRTSLMRHDLSAPGRETLQALVEFAPGAVFPRHSHPGEELVFVVRGSFEYHLDGSAPVTLNAGEVLFIPSGRIHAVKNVGKGSGAELATYVLEKGKPPLTLAP